MKYFEILPNDITHIILTKLNYINTISFISEINNINYKYLLYTRFKDNIINKLLNNKDINYTPDKLYLNLLELIDTNIVYNYIKKNNNENNIINKIIIFELLENNNLFDGNNQFILSEYINTEILLDIYKEDLLKCEKLNYKRNINTDIYLSILYLLYDVEYINKNHLYIGDFNDNLIINIIYTIYLKTIVDKLPNLYIYKHTEDSNFSITIIKLMVFIIITRFCKRNIQRRCNYWN